MGSRFLYDNLITDENMITVSSLRTGLVTTALKDGTGSAVIAVSGSFSGSQDLEYIVEIDSVAGGAEVGQATFKWSDGGGGWDASGVATSATNITLNNGVNILWTAGSGAFVVGDKWYFKGINLYNAGKMIDLDRDTRYRSAALSSPNTITVDLGSAQEVKALVLFDHNLTSNATITLEADAAATFDSDGGNPEFSEAITWVSGKILHYLSTATTKRYWRIKITDTTNADGYIEIGELFLGSYMELSREFSGGYQKPLSLLHRANENPYGRSMKRFYNTQRSLEYPFVGLVAADLTLLEALVSAVSERSTGKLNPFFFNEDSADPSKTWLVELTEVPETHMVRSYFELTLSMIEVVESV